MKYKIEHIDFRTLILRLPAKWKSLYFWEKERNFDGWNSKEKEEIYKKVTSLDLTTCTVEEVEAIIGNDNWTRINCSMCNKYVLDAVVIEYDDCETPNTRFCRMCFEDLDILWQKPCERS